MAFPDVADRPLTELFSLAGRAAVVTGGARGIGQAICRRLAEAGAAVLVADLDEAGAQATAESLAAYHRPRAFMAVDTRHSASVEQVADRALREFGHLDIWVNDAGIYPLKPALDITDDDWTRVINTNLSGVFYGARAAARRMQAAGQGGVIINLASSLGYHGVKEQASYVTSKFGVRGLTAALALEWGPLGIRVLAIGPGYTDTPGMAAAQPALDTLAPGHDAPAAYAKTSPAGRMGTADDIARAVVFAASDLAMYMTGSTLLVDGGEVAAGRAG